MSTGKAYAEFKKEIDTIRKNINKIPPSTKCPEGKHYKVDPKNKVVFYNPYNNQNGKPDYDLNEAIGNMKEIAAREKMPVVTLFHESILVIDESLSIDESLKKFYEYRKQKDEAYEQTPEYKKAKTLQNIEQQKKGQQLAADAKILASTSLELSNPKAFEEFKTKNFFGEMLADFSRDYAKLMQNEINSSSNHKLTKKIVNDAFQRATLKHAPDGEGTDLAHKLLIKTWKYGKELGKILGYSAKEIQYIRNPEQASEQAEGERTKATKNRIAMMANKIKARLSR